MTTFPRLISTLVLRVLLLALTLTTACAEKSYTWAFAQDLDGTVKPNELCRTTLADALYRTTEGVSTVSLNDTNVFIVRGTVESYRVHAYHSQSECEAVLDRLRRR